jgi:hypothetical protein
LEKQLIFKGNDFFLIFIHHASSCFNIFIFSLRSLLTRWSVKLIYIVLKNLVPILQKSYWVSIAKATSLMLLGGGGISDDNEYHPKPINTFCGQNAEIFNIVASGTYTDHHVLKD